MFTGNQREAFLAFLRNLTPQIAFLTLALISASRLDGTLQADGEGVRNALPMLMSLFVFFGATIANISVFIDAAATSTPEMQEAAKAIKEEIPAGVRRSRKLLIAAWQHNKSAIFNLVLVMIIAEAALTLVFLLAVQAALATPFMK